MIQKVRFFKDPEFYFILFYNAMIIGMYQYGKLDYMFVIWAYLLQSIFMGAQYVIHSLIFTTRFQGGFLPLKKHAFTGFFFIHYGGFHAVYLIFLIVMSTQVESNMDQMIALIKYVKYTAYFLLFNLLLYAGRQALPTMPDHRRPSIVMAYLRIIPMHLIIILGLNSKFVLDSFIIFMILKTIFDLIMYRYSGGEVWVQDENREGGS